MMPQTLFSLTRFQKEKPKLPCWIAGRFFKLNSKNYLLKSQGLLFFCESKKNNEYQEGSWIAVQVLSPLSASQISTSQMTRYLNRMSRSLKKSNSFKTKFSSSELQQRNLETNSQALKNPSEKTWAGYQTGKSYLLQSPSTSYKEKAFSYQKKGAVLQEWFDFLRSVEDFFISKGLAFAETPYLVKCPGTEPHLKALKSSFKNYYLPTSPELQLKKLLCQDWTDFFEIKTCFREEESNEIHQVEFHLLEWYRAFYSLEELMRELYELIVFLQQPYREETPPAQFLTVSELFERHLQFTLTPKTSKKELFNLAKKETLPAQEDFSFEDLFFTLFLNKIESQLCQKTPLFIYNYPPQLRAFAQINSKGWADRFEFYWKGLELANAFYEVTQFEEQQKLFQDHLRQRTDEIPLDEELLPAMKEGMPPCSGAALGLDRLFLALTGKKNLKSTRLFPF